MKKEPSTKETRIPGNGKRECRKGRIEKIEKQEVLRQGNISIENQKGSLFLRGARRHG